MQAAQPGVGCAALPNVAEKLYQLACFAAGAEIHDAIIPISRTPVYQAGFIGDQKRFVKVLIVGMRFAHFDLAVETVTQFQEAVSLIDYAIGILQQDMDECVTAARCNAGDSVDERGVIE